MTSLWADQRVSYPLHVRPSTPAARLAGGKQHPAFRTKPPLALELEGLGAFRADVSGAGPAVYGLFEREEGSLAAAAALGSLGTTWICAPTWYG